MLFGERLLSYFCTVILIYLSFSHLTEEALYIWYRNLVCHFIPLMGCSSGMHGSYQRSGQLRWETFGSNTVNVAWIPDLSLAVTW